MDGKVLDASSGNVARMARAVRTLRTGHRAVVHLYVVRCTSVRRTEPVESDGGCKGREGILMTENRRNAGVVGGIAAVLLFYLVNPWVNPEPGGTINQIVTVAFWISFIVLLVFLFQERNQPGGETIEIEGPAFTRFLFSNSTAGLFWLPVRLFLGFSWLEAGLPQGLRTGLARRWRLPRGLLEGRGGHPGSCQGRPAITFEWYRTFLQFLLDNGAEKWMGWVIPFGEMAVGLGLLLGILTGFAAFFGAFMNMSFLLAGSASTNPVLFTLAIGLMLAWKVAGYYGVDRWLLPMLGTPWHPRVMAGKETSPGHIGTRPAVDDRLEGSPGTPTTVDRGFFVSRASRPQSRVAASASGSTLRTSAGAADTANPAASSVRRATSARRRVRERIDGIPFGRR